MTYSNRLQKVEINNKIKEDLWNFIISEKLQDKIRELLEANHSFGMILDFLRKFYFSSLPKDANLILLTYLLRQKGYKCNAKGYNSQSQYWKLQYRYTEKEIREQCKRGNSLTISKRKYDSINGKDYNKKQGVKFYIDLGLSYEEAKREVEKYKNENSPRRIEFYIKKGYSPEEAKQKVSDLAILGTIAALKKTQKPKTEQVVARWLTDNGIKYQAQYKMKLSKEESFFGKKFYAFDFYLPDFNCLIETNGTYWHADPRFFKEDDVVYLPGRVNGVLAREIWNADKIKCTCATNKGYNLFYVWEKEINSNIYPEIIKNELSKCDRN